MEIYANASSAATRDALPLDRLLSRSTYVSAMECPSSPARPRTRPKWLPKPGSVVRSEQVVGVFADVRDAESGGGGKQPAYSPLLSSRARILSWALRGRPALVVEH
jgi:hypothetical protein